MTYNINILEQAEQDIKDIYYYIAYNDSKEKALTLIDELESTCFKLENFPERGIVPHELKEIGIHFKSPGKTWYVKNKIL